MIQLRILLYSIVSLFVFRIWSVIPTNFFEPYDVLIKPERPAYRATEWMIGYEGALSTHGFMGDDDLCMTTCEKTKGNVLQIYQKEQNAIAALKGFDPESEIGQQAQLLTIDDDNQTRGIFTPCGHLTAHNFLFGAQFRIPHNISLALYIPYRFAELSRVRWNRTHEGHLFEDEIIPDLIKKIEELGTLNLRGWKRHGFGDLLLAAEYYFHRPQTKEYLRNVGVELRGGLLVPTGLREDPDKLLALPFGYDAGFGIMAAGRLELWYVHNIRFGVEAQITQLFGNTRCRRIKSDPAQTDLLLLTKIPVFKDPGFYQHFTLFADALFIGGTGFSSLIAYQYTKRSEDRYFLCAQGFDPAIVNNAESLQDSTAHNAIFKLGYTWCPHPQSKATPSLAFFLKWGFNGKRAILANTAGFTFHIAF